MRRDWRRVHRSSHSSLTELNMTPLLDLVFVLLVIFIIATPQLMNNLPLFLPSGNAPSTKPQINTINVSSLGQIKFNDEQMTLAQLKQTLVQIKASRPDASFQVDGASDTDYQKVVDVFDLLRQLGFTKVGLVTEVE